MFVDIVISLIPGARVISYFGSHSLELDIYSRFSRRIVYALNHWATDPGT